MNKIKRIIPTVRRLPPRLMDRIVMIKFILKILGKIGKGVSPEKWIFIIGCYNSGTTLIANMLQNHPLIGGLRTEGAYLTDSLPYPEQFGWPRMWCECLDKITISPGLQSANIAKNIVRQWSIWCPKNTPILVEKSVSNAARIPFLNEYFKPAYFIHIIRNGYAVSGGIREKANLKRWKNPIYDRYPIELCAKQWCVNDAIVERDSKNMTNLLKIYYEDLVSDPQVTVRAITDFLGIEAMPDDAFRKGYIVHGERSVIKNMNKLSLQRLGRSDFKKIKDVAGDSLEKHGYTYP